MGAGQNVIAPWLVSLAIATVGWLLALLGYIYHQGRRDQRIAEMENQLDTLEKEGKRSDRMSVERMTVFRRELQADMEKFFYDSDGRAKVMSRDTCELSQRNCAGKFEYLKEDLQKSQEQQVARDNEIFNRIRGMEEKMAAVEKHVVKIATSIRMLNISDKLRCSPDDAAILADD